MTFKEISERIRRILDQNKRIAIYPFGEYGFEAWQIATQRFGQEDVLCIDNGMSQYNKDVLSWDEFCAFKTQDVSVLICAESMDLNRRLTQQIIEQGFCYENILSPLAITNDAQTRYFKKLRTLLEIKAINGKRLIRVGGKRDGGYILPEDYKDIDLAFSFGIGRNVVFDSALTESGMNVYCFDHTINTFPSDSPRLHWIKKGIGSSTYEDFISIQYALKEYSAGDINMLLKMDVEGAEWDFFDSLQGDELNRFKIMTFELHGLLWEERKPRVINALERINKTHQVVWIHGNNNSDLIETAGGVIVPNLIEVTFVKRSEYDFEDIEYTVPSKLDYPNVERRYDIDMGNWGSANLK